MLAADGWLPVGKHRVTVDEFREHFVDAFPESRTRSRLFRRWERHREALASILPIKTQWIDGSYVTNKLDPEDVDLVTVMDGLAFEALAPALQDMAGALLGGNKTKVIWGVDSYPLFEYPDEHPAKAAADAAAVEWHSFWQGARDHDGVVKGFLEVVA